MTIIRERRPPVRRHFEKTGLYPVQDPARSIVYYFIRPVTRLQSKIQLVFSLTYMTHLSKDFMKVELVVFVSRRHSKYRRPPRRFEESDWNRQQQQSTICSVLESAPKSIESVLSWTIPCISTRCHQNRASSRCVLLLQTDRHTDRHGQSISSSPSVMEAITVKRLRCNTVAESDRLKCQSEEVK